MLIIYEAYKWRRQKSSRPPQMKPSRRKNHQPILRNCHFNRYEMTTQRQPDVGNGLSLLSLSLLRADFRAMDSSVVERMTQIFFVF
ncbi:hypothetical protein D918_07405 [Trichuris suis]|nr:hypothetical protein D918_07405 [Trichuris suis]